MGYKFVDYKIVVKSLTLDRRWFNNVFISETIHLTNRFCEVILGSTTIVRIVYQLLVKFYQTSVIYLCPTCRLSSIVVLNK